MGYNVNLCPACFQRLKPRLKTTYDEEPLSNCAFNFMLCPYSVAWFTKSAEAGYPQAMSNLADCYQQGDGRA